MAIDRRHFLLAGSSLLLAPGLEAVAECSPDVFAATCREPSGSYAAVAYRDGCGVQSHIALPARGHDLVQRPETQECVVFARRPGTFAIAFSADGRGSLTRFHTPADRHFFGHGAFSRDGRLLLTSENDFGASRGVIGVYDASGRYRRIGEFDAGGLEPHDLCLLADGRTLVVANGGIETHPQSNREKLNIPTMEPSLAYIDSKTGDVLENHALPKALHQLSIRHLAVGHADHVFFGCQFEGPAARHPPLIGFHKRGGKMHLIEAPDSLYRAMRNYVGSVAADRSGDLIAATSPRGGLAVVVDAASRRILGQQHLSDVCGVAERHGGAGFWLTSGLGNVGAWSPGVSNFHLAHEDLAWDNHAITLERA